jgi:hypothetical protein
VSAKIAKGAHRKDSARIPKEFVFALLCAFAPFAVKIFSPRPNFVGVFNIAVAVHARLLLQILMLYAE